MNEFRDRETPGGLPGALRELSWSPPESFLGLPSHESLFESARVVVLPVPYEATVSYMCGTRFGPRGLLHASRYLELYDHELAFEPYRVGIQTLPELVLSGDGPEEALNQLRHAFDLLLDEGKFVIMVGGEHSVSGPPILAHADRMADGVLSVLQLDAHADLRAEYEGTTLSHACVMHGVVDRVNLVPAGIRSLTSDEAKLIEERNIPVTYAHELERDDEWIERVLAALGDEVYLTVDVDYFDPSLIPSTGTPEPGGGTWYPTLRLLERVFREKTVVGSDIVELAPLPGMVAPDFLAAKLLYKIVAFFAKFGNHI
ncbi:MAG: agmatinase [Gemmatimonadales bacterium]